jgi:hypothetical protein
MNLHRALAHLAAIGITSDVLRAGDVDPADPGQVRAEVETLLHSALAENSILIGMRHLAKLQMALGLLLTPAEHAEGDAVARLLREQLLAAGVITEAPELVGTCLADA